MSLEAAENNVALIMVKYATQQLRYHYYVTTGCTRKLVYHYPSQR